MNKNILVIEDDKDIANLLKIHLADLYSKVDLAYAGDIGLKKFYSNSYDMVILDIMLPGLDGIEICRRIRKESKYTPILMLTAKTSERDRIAGLAFGADDYMTKPFSIEELLARIHALFRLVSSFDRDTQLGKKSIIESGEFIIDIEKHRVTLMEKPIRLTSKEFDLLVHFVSHPGRVYTRSQLLNEVWGYSFQGYEHTVNSHINRLRAKIEKDPAYPKYILTVFGVGYKFRELLDVEA